MVEDRRRRSAASPRPARPHPASTSRVTRDRRDHRSQRDRGRKVYKPALRIPLKRQATRINILGLIMALVLTSFLGRAFLLQAFDARAYASQAAAAMKASKTLVPQRGSITDRNGMVLAASEPAVKIIADPLMIARNGVDPRLEMGPKQTAKAKAAPGAIADILVKHIGGNHDEYLRVLTDTGRKHYAIVAEKVPAYTFQQIAKELAEGKWFGVYKEDDPIRYYPSGDVVSGVVGFMGTDDKTGQPVGTGGLEYTFNKQLTGTYGKEIFDTSRNGRIPLGNRTLIPATNGADLQLTIDSEMQLFANQALAKGITDAGAKNGMAIVMDVKTGELLAISTSPGFDSNTPAKADPENLGNTAASAPYEPGSVQKVLTLAALTDAGRMTPDTRVEIPARLPSGDGMIKDAWPHGTIYLTGRGVMANSSNIGTVLVARQMPKAQMLSYYAKFGLGRKTNVGLPGESSGWLPKEDMPNYSYDQIVFGQGLTTNALQMAAAVAAVANKGVYVAPKLLRASSNDEGQLVPTPQGETRRVISEKAARQTLEMMESVITKSEDRTIANYRVAGKTGTAQRVDPSCGCYRGYTASFVGVAPAEDPRLLVYVVIDQPTRGSDGSKLALPVAQQIMSTALPRYGVKPSSTPAPKGPLEYKP